MPVNLLVVDALAVALAMLARCEIAAAFETIFAVRYKAGRFLSAVMLRRWSVIACKKKVRANRCHLKLAPPAPTKAADVGKS
jgi:hypothetical protein